MEPVSGAKLPHPDHHRPRPVDSAENGNGDKSKTPTYVRDANERYVARHVEEFAALGIEAKGQVVCGDAVEEILRAALDLRCDLIAMASRKLSGFHLQQNGSIAEEVLWRSKLPVLLIAAG